MNRFSKIIVSILCIGIVVLLVFLIKGKIPKNVNQIREYQSPLGIKFQYSPPWDLDNQAAIGPITIEERDNVISLFPTNQPDFRHSIAVYKKSKEIPIQKAITSKELEFKKSQTKFPCSITVEQIKPATNGQLRYSIEGGLDQTVEYSLDADIACRVNALAQYNPKKPDIYLIFRMGQDTFLDLPVFLDSLEIQ